MSHNPSQPSAASLRQFVLDSFNRPESYFYDLKSNLPPQHSTDCHFLGTVAALHNSYDYVTSIMRPTMKAFFIVVGVADDEFPAFITQLSQFHSGMSNNLVNEHAVDCPDTHQLVQAMVKNFRSGSPSGPHVGVGFYCHLLFHFKNSKEEVRPVYIFEFICNNDLIYFNGKCKVRCSDGSVDLSQLASWQLLKLNEKFDIMKCQIPFNELIVLFNSEEFLMNSKKSDDAHFPCCLLWNLFSIPFKAFFDLSINHALKLLGVQPQHYITNDKSAFDDSGHHSQKILYFFPNNNSNVNDPHHNSFNVLSDDFRCWPPELGKLLEDNRTKVLIFQLSCSQLWKSTVKSLSFDHYQIYPPRKVAEFLMNEQKTMRYRRIHRFKKYESTELVQFPPAADNSNQRDLLIDFFSGEKPSLSLFADPCPIPSHSNVDLLLSSCLDPIFQENFKIGILELSKNRYCAGLHTSFLLSLVRFTNAFRYVVLSETVDLMECIRHSTSRLIFYFPKISLSKLVSIVEKTFNTEGCENFQLLNRVLFVCCSTYINPRGNRSLSTKMIVTRNSFQYTKFVWDYPELHLSPDWRITVERILSDIKKNNVPSAIDPRFNEIHSDFLYLGLELFQKKEDNARMIVAEYLRFLCESTKVNNVSHLNTRSLQFALLFLCSLSKDPTFNFDTKILCDAFASSKHFLLKRVVLNFDLDKSYIHIFVRKFIVEYNYQWHNNILSSHCEKRSPEQIAELLISSISLVKSHCSNRFSESHFRFSEFHDNIIQVALVDQKDIVSSQMAISLVQMLLDELKRSLPNLQLFFSLLKKFGCSNAELAHEYLTEHRLIKCLDDYSDACDLNKVRMSHTLTEAGDLLRKLFHWNVLTIDKLSQALQLYEDALLFDEQNCYAKCGLLKVWVAQHDQRDASSSLLPSTVENNNFVDVQLFNELVNIPLISGNYHHFDLSKFDDPEQSFIKLICTAWMLHCAEESVQKLLKYHSNFSLTEYLFTADNYEQLSSESNTLLKCHLYFLQLLLSDFHLSLSTFYTESSTVSNDLVKPAKALYYFLKHLSCEEKVSYEFTNISDFKDDCFVFVNIDTDKYKLSLLSKAKPGSLSFGTECLFSNSKTYFGWLDRNIYRITESEGVLKVVGESRIL
ncbi:hypothetical protein P9112_010355 [Eukaryota sp. TZLM1-RC]